MLGAGRTLYPRCWQNLRKWFHLELMSERELGSAIRVPFKEHRPQPSLSFSGMFLDESDRQGTLHQNYSLASAHDQSSRFGGRGRYVSLHGYGSSLTRCAWKTFREKRVRHHVAQRSMLMLAPDFPAQSVKVVDCSRFSGMRRAM